MNKMPDRLEEKDDQVTEILNRSQCSISFNVMPDRKVSEVLTMSAFRVGDDWIEAIFDRTYESEMLNSPTHLTFIAALIQCQKIVYVYCCSKFGFPTDVYGDEQLKIWPTHVKIAMPKMVTDDYGIRHRLEFHEFKKIEHRKYLVSAKSNVNEIITIDFSVIVHLLRDP